MQTKVRAGIMQPYFLPYIGYWQLIGAVDVFVIYDDIKYTKKGWINRNRLLRNGGSAVITLPVKGGSDALQVREREIASDFDPRVVLNRIAEAYRRAPHLSETMPLLESVLHYAERNLFQFLHHSILRTCEHLGVTTPVRISSHLAVDPDLRHQDRVLALCKAVGATTYINPIGGTELYSREAFAADGIELRFLQASPFEYTQFGNAFVPWLSIIDVLMFNSRSSVRGFIASKYALV